MSVSIEKIGQRIEPLTALGQPPGERRRLGESFMLWLLFGTMIMLAITLLGDLVRGIFR